jgi:hypothetical protein
MLNIVAAFKSPRSGQVFTGCNHGEAFYVSDIKSIEDLTETEFLKAEGFSAPDGTKFMSREKALAKFGVSTSEDLERK